MRSVVFFLGLILLFSCKSRESDKLESTETTDSIASQQQTGNLNPVKLTANQIPTSIKFRGNVVEAWSWNDKAGENLLVTSAVAATTDKQNNEWGEETRSAELHAYHFIKKDSGYKLLWKTSDAEKGCGFDITAEFVKGSVTITDLDRDGQAETTVQYKLACRSDVSPAYMKLVMHEDTAKFALRGNMWIKASEQDSFTVTEQTLNLEKLPRKRDEFEQLEQSFGRYETEKDFARAPAEFLLHARQQWMKFVKESFE